MPDDGPATVNSTHLTLLLPQELTCFPHQPARKRIPQRIGFDDLRAVDIYTEFEEPAFDDFDFEIFLVSQFFRHPGGYKLLGGSDRAIADFYFSHDWLLCRWTLR